MTPGNPAVIRVEGVSRWFGNVVAVSDVTFEVSPGITGLLGPNGAGKTTLLRMMTGLAEVSDGAVTIFGEPVRDNPPLYRRIGVMSEHETVYGFMKGRDFVAMMGRLRGVTDLDAAVERAIGFVDLADAADRPMGTYSRGMRQRMRLAGTLVHDPEILILDEPLNGADPRQRVHFQSLLRDLAEQGRTIILSSHILEEVEQLAETVLLIVNGKLAASGDFRAIRAALDERPYHVLVVADAPRELAAAVVQLDSVEAVNVDPDGKVVVLSRNVRSLQVELPRLAQSASITLRRVEPLVVLAVASVAFANEIEDKTLANLTLSPLPRWQIVAPKLLAAITVSGFFLATSAVVTSHIAFDGDLTTTAAVTLASIIGVALYGSVFVWLGLVTTRAIAFGLVYIVVWEGYFAGFVTGVRSLSIRYHTIALMHGFDGRRFAEAQTLSFGFAVGAAMVVFVGFLLLAIRRLRRMDVP